MRGGHAVSPDQLPLLNAILAGYVLGPIQEVRVFHAGRRRAAKWRVTTAGGGYLLKRRPAAAPRLARARLAHAAQSRLGAAGFPLAGLIPQRGDAGTLLVRDDTLIELFHWVEGTRCAGTPAAVAAAGATLARLHVLMDPAPEAPDVPVGGYHDAERVRRQLDVLARHEGAEAPTGWRRCVDRLRHLYEEAADRVERLGYGSWPTTLNHGDWHPGNLLFRGETVVAVLDFDAVQLAPPAAEVANGLLQFSLVAGDPQPAHWPAACDPRRLVSFWQGYCRGSGLTAEQVTALPDLMVETLVAEVVLPIAATGIFDQPHGLGFMQMIARKAQWLDARRVRLAEILREVPAGSPAGDPARVLGA